MLGGRASPICSTSSRWSRATAGWIACGRSIARPALLYEQLRGRVPVQLTTAAAAGRCAGRADRRGLRRLLGGEPVLERAVDPELIGGAVVRVGDTVYDGSIANQLENLRQQMIDRSAHEIQSRRDRFRYPAGN